MLVLLAVLHMAQFEDHRGGPENTERSEVFFLSPIPTEFLF